MSTTEQEPLGPEAAVAAPASEQHTANLIALARALDENRGALSRVATPRLDGDGRAVGALERAAREKVNDEIDAKIAHLLTVASNRLLPSEADHA